MGVCGGFKTTCGRCPILASQSVQDLSSWTLRRKHKSFGKLDVSIAADSDWIGQYSHQSSLFKNRRLGVIANGLDLKIFTPWVQSKARSQLNLPLDKKLLLFGAVNATSDSRKGFHLLKPALEQLRTRPKATTEVELVIFGAQPSAAEFVSGFKTHFIPSCNQEELLPAVYSSADAIVIPSVEDNLPNIATEGLACGVPVVAFAVGGLPEIIDHGQNGYLARPYEVADLATGLDSTLFMDSSHRQAYAAAAKSKVARAFDLSNISARYEAFYREILDDRTRSLASARRMI